MKHLLPIAAILLAFTACMNRGGNSSEIKTEDSLEQLPAIKDTAVYGTIGEATTMHTLQLVTEDGKTLSFAIDQNQEADVQGGIYAGDHVTLTVYPKTDDEEMPEVRKLVNITSLLGKYTSIDRNFEIKEGGEIQNSSITAEAQPYTQWSMANAMLILNADTFAIDALNPDSLTIENAKGIYVYKRSQQAKDK